MDLYDPEFPCDSDITEFPNDDQNNGKTESINHSMTSNEDFPPIDLNDVELPPTVRAKPNLDSLIEPPSSKNEDGVGETFSSVEPSLGISMEKNFLEKVDDVDGEAFDDEASYRDELRRSAASRNTKEYESKSSKDVPLEMYLGPSVGFRVDLTINKGRKSNVESIARRRHELSDADLFDRLSPDPSERSKVKGKGSDGERNGNKIEIRIPKLGSPDGKLDDSREVDQSKKSELTFDRSKEDHTGFEKSQTRKRDSSPSSKSKRNEDFKSGDALSSQKSISIESEKENVDLPRRHNEPKSESKKSKSRLESEEESSGRDGKSSSVSLKSRHKDVHVKDRGSKEVPSKRSGKDDREGKHVGRDPEKRAHRKKSGSKGRTKDQAREQTKEHFSDSDAEPAPPTWRKRRRSRSPSHSHKKLSVKKSKSKSPKRKINKSKSRDHRNVRKSRSRSRVRDQRQEKKSEAKSKHKARHPADHPRSDPTVERRRHRRSRSKSPAQEIESKRRKDQSRHSNFRESSFFDGPWDYDARGSRNSKTQGIQSAARDLPDAGTSLLEACMRTRYEKCLNDDPWRSRSRPNEINNSSRKFGPTIDYITVSDSDEGIVWSDNDDGYGNYSAVTTPHNSASKKLKYEDIYSSRNLQVENRTPVTASRGKKKSKRKKEPSLSPSAILAINLKRKENAKKRENIKITKSVSRSSLEPGEIDDRSSVSSGDNIVEDISPSKRKVSLMNEADVDRPPGEKVPIQIHVITSHGDDRDKEEEVAMDFDEGVSGAVTTSGETESDEKLRAKQQLDSKEQSERRHGSSENELTGDASACNDNSSLLVERSNQTLKEVRRLLSRVEGFSSHLDDVDSGSSKVDQAGETADNLKQKTKVMAAENKAPLDVVSPKVAESKANLNVSQDSDALSPASQTIPGLGDSCLSPEKVTLSPEKTKEKENEASQVSGRDIALSQPSFFQIKKKMPPEQPVLKLDNGVERAKHHEPQPHGSALARNLTIQSKEEFAKPLFSPKRSPTTDALSCAMHHMPALVATSFPTLSTATVSTTSIGSFNSAASEELPVSSLVADLRPGKVVVPPTGNPPLLGAPFAFNQGALMDFLTPLQTPVLPSLSSLVTPMGVANDASLSKLLAAITPSVAPLNSQKLIDDFLKASTLSPEISVKPQLPKVAAHPDDQLSSLFGIQKKLTELSRMSNAAPHHPPAPISQRLVQDIFKAVLPTISGVPDMSSLCPPPAEMPCTLSDDDCVSDTSLLDYRSPSFSPPSLPDKNSPGKDLDILPSSQETRSKGPRVKNKADGVIPDGLVKEKTSKAEIQKVVVEYVKSVIRPFYSKGRINKDEYKEILRKTVPKICHSKTQDFSKTRITIYVEAYARKVMATRKYNARKKDP